MVISTLYIKAAQEAGELVAEAMRKELRAQGHDASGDLIKSIKPVVRETPDGIDIDIMALEYAKGVNQGQPIGTLVPIDRLIKWIRDVGIVVTTDSRSTIEMRAEEYQRIIFKKGTPTKGSYKFSHNGRRTQFIEESVKASEAEFYDLLEKKIGDQIEIEVDSLIKQLTD